MSLIIFEDSLVENFYPLTLTRASFELLSGTKTILERIVEGFGTGQVSLFARDYLSAVLKQRMPGYRINMLESGSDVVLANGLLNMSYPEFDGLIHRRSRFIALSRNNVAVARIPAKLLEKFKENETFSTLAKTKEYDVIEVAESALYRYPWELVDGNAKAITRQANGKPSRQNLGSGIYITGPKNLVFISQAADLEPPVTINTSGGPVIVEERALIQGMTRLEGPCHIGRGTKVRSALIGEGTSVGQSCIIGGEIEHSIVSGYTNKAHLGYLGHSIVGSWVNLGAQTTNSNLKNTYGNIRAKIGKQEVSTSRMKIGCYIGDNVKTAIGSLVLAGKKIGIASHLYGMAADDIPSFTIYAKSLGKEPYEMQLHSAIETQNRMMSRRGIKQTNDDVKLLRKVFTMTSVERSSLKVIKGRFRI